MIDTPEITRSEDRHAAVIHFTIPKDQIQHVMGPGMQELLSTVAAQGVTPTGPVFSHHFRMSPDSWDFEIGVPVAAPFPASGRVQPGKLPAARVARTVYTGGYEGLGAAWGAFMEWIAAQGHKPAENLWESYLTSPAHGEVPVTELVRPLAD